MKSKENEDELKAASEVFVQTLNPMRGRMEWKAQPSDYDYQQEVARAAFADMLHDSERNHLYYVGLEAAVKKKRREGQRVHVLDIGTGTGLLSMMAVRLGADKVTAIEEFAPMVSCAEKVMTANGCWDQIQLIKKRSTEVTVGRGKEFDMQERANILITEVFDTELIGEGAISVFNHAHKHLLTDDCLVIPCEATIYAQVVDSDLADRWNRLQEIEIATADGGSAAVAPPDAEESSSTSLSLHDIQMSQMKPEWFKPLSDPVPVFKFDFGASGGGRIPNNEQTVRTVSVRGNGGGRCSAVFMWWDIFMDPDKEVLLSCAPVWAHPLSDSLPWRDHWMQAIYYPLSSALIGPQDKEMTLVSNHDEYSFWFDVIPGAVSDVANVPMPSPAAGIHLAVSRPRLGQINDADRNRKLVSAMDAMLDKHVRDFDGRLPESVLCLSEQSLLPVIFAAIFQQHKKRRRRKNDEDGDPKVRIYVSDGGKQMSRLLDRYFHSQSFQGAELIKMDANVAELTPAHFPNKIDMVIGEPNFSFSLLPWHNLFFWFSLHSMFTFEKDDGEEKSDEQANVQMAIRDEMVMPRSATLYALPVQYRDLWKIRAPVGSTEGFDLGPFDNLIMKASDGCDLNVEPHPLWEYPCKALGKPKPVATFEFSKPIHNFQRETCLPLEWENIQDLNGMALWIDWHLNEELSMTTGPRQEVVVGQDVEWDVHAKQGVHLFPKHKSVNVTGNQQQQQQSVNCKVVFDSKEGELLFDFAIFDTDSKGK